MADIVLVPANVLPGDGAQYFQGIAGVALAAGDVCILDTTTQRIILANSSAVATSRVRGIASHAAAVGQPIRVQTAGLLQVGGSLLTVAELYVLSGLTPGKIAPVADLATGDYLTVLGVGQTANVLQMRLWATELLRA